MKAAGAVGELAPANERTLRLTPLGAGCEVGRSCILLEFRGRSILFDCGVHPGNRGIGALPFFDGISAERMAAVDLCLVTHFHLDHCGAVPYLACRTRFSGLVVMTAPTLAVARMLWRDHARLAAGRAAAAAGSEFTLDGDAAVRPLFDSLDVDRCVAQIRTVGHRERLDFPDLGISLLTMPAGHVVGAVMFLVEIDGMRILYTGDFSREPERHVPPAEIPHLPVDVLVCEATYGIRCHENRQLRERRFLTAVRTVLRNGGQCLLPVFALGRVQELLFMLEECWRENSELRDIPIFYASPMSVECLPIFEAWAESCGGEYVKNLIDDGRKPFHFKYVKLIQNFESLRQHLDSPLYGGRCVALASPGMLQSGISRALFERWAPDHRNGIVLTGYAVRGTLAEQLRQKPAAVDVGGGKSTPVNCSVEVVSFSAHSDFNQTREFIERVHCPIVVLVHGEKNQMAKLADKLRTLALPGAPFPELSTGPDLVGNGPGTLNRQPVDGKVNAETTPPVSGGPGAKPPPTPCLSVFTPQALQTVELTFDHSKVNADHVALISFSSSEPKVLPMDVIAATPRQPGGIVHLFSPDDAACFLGDAPERCVRSFALPTALWLPYIAKLRELFGESLVTVGADEVAHPETGVTIHRIDDGEAGGNVRLRCSKDTSAARITVEAAAYALAELVRSPA